MRRDVFQAIADPTRREIIQLLSHKSMNLNAVADNFNISRPAISKHIKILTQCGLVEINQQGRERYCKAKLEGLSDVASWVVQYKASWEEKLDRLDIYLKKNQKPKQK
jgi:DNA-binding transcriptional ArsR family regulator